MKRKIGIVGAGSWGTALAKLLAEKGESVTIWCFETDVARGINTQNINPFYLSTIKLPPDIRATNDLKEAVSSMDFIISAVPSRFVRRIWNDAGKYLDNSAILISATKGIEIDTHKLMSGVLDDCIGSHPSSLRTFLSGPSFAPEVAKNLPTSVVVAATNPDTAQNREGPGCQPHDIHRSRRDRRSGFNLHRGPIAKSHRR
jgi:glycerol-3-phosphate dehydrogenase (NAD(P)+)